jgi:hypothetical protein
MDHKIFDRSSTTYLPGSHPTEHTPTRTSAPKQKKALLVAFAVVTRSCLFLLLHSMIPGGPRGVPTQDSFDIDQNFFDDEETCC